MVSIQTSSFSGSIKRKLLSGGFWAFLGKGSTALITLAVNAMLARMLSPGELGVYFIAFSIVMLGATIGTLGLNQTAIRYIADNMVRENTANVIYIVKKTFLFVFIGSVLVGLTYYFSSNWIAQTLFGSMKLGTISVLVAIWIGVNVYQRVIGEQFRGFHDIQNAALYGGVVSSALFISSLLIFQSIKLIQFNLELVIILTIGSLIVSNIIGIVLLNKKVRRIKNQSSGTGTVKSLTSKIILLTSFPIMITNISSFFLIQSDIWIIGAVGGEVEIAIYGAAAKLVAISLMPLIVVDAVLLPMIAEKHAQGKLKNMEPLIRIAGTFAGLPALLLLIIFIFFGKPILTLVFGPFYSEGFLILVILAIKQLVIGWNGVCGSIMMMTGSQKQLMINSIFTGIFSIVLAILLGRNYGGTGVALGYLLANLISQFLMWLYVRKKFRIRSDADVIGAFLQMKILFKHKYSKNLSS